MNAALFLIIGCAVLIVGYIFYGGWLAKKWGVDNSRPTPAHTMEDGKDYCPAKAPVLMGHHFSSIAGAGPINGPIQAAVFGWVPVMLWVLIGGIFFGGVHDFGALFASIRHKGESIGEVIGDAEAFKGVWDISAPISGTVLRINDDLLDDPQSINSDPYGSWLAEFGDAERGAKLMTAQEYCKYLGKEAEMI